MSFFHTPGAEILWTWHMSRSAGRPVVGAAVDPNFFLRLSFGARFASPGAESVYAATVTLISRDSGRAYHHTVPWQWRTDLGNEIMFQLMWLRAADATQDERGLFLFQPTLVFLYQESVGGDNEYIPTDLKELWTGESEYAVTPEPHYILMEGVSLYQRRRPNPYLA